MLNSISRTRHRFIFTFLFLASFLLIIRLSFLQIFNQSFLKLAKRQHSVTFQLEPRRGVIFDREMRIMALSLSLDSVYANPREVVDTTATARRLARLLSVDEHHLVRRLSQDKGFVWVKRKISENESVAIKKDPIAGIGLLKESKRFYPNGPLGCHIVGVVGLDNTGLEGIELSCDQYLRGSSGWQSTLRDGKRRPLLAFENEYVPPRNGYNVILTIDEVIQNIAERELEKAFKTYRAKGATIIVMDPKDGDILALANFPNFDPNRFSHVSADARRNRAITDYFEPGSSFKVITASAALEKGVVTFNDVFFCENGSYKVGRRVLRDHRPHGRLTFREVIEQSSNIGTVKVASLLGSATLYEYIRRFGFYDKTGVDLPGEAESFNRDLSKWTKGSMLAIPMGQEVVATAMQLACALSCIVNGGEMIKPRMVREIIDEKGVTIKVSEPQVTRRVIREETSAKMRRLLKGVVDNGTGKSAKLDNFTAGGKTGTAQKVEPGGGYSHSRFVASFIGFAPAENPLVCIVVCIDEPRPLYYGGVVAAPVFKNVGQEVVKYLLAAS